jgi:hypothetical protein
MKSTTAITVISSKDGFLDDLIPDAGLLIDDQLEKSGALETQP